MIFTQENEYSAVLDACVLVPMALCDLLLRLAEEPAMYRPLWSERILAEMAKALKTKLHRSSEEVARRRQQMNEAFPEALVPVPSELLRAVECIPDKDDRHVLAAAIMARANTIVTQNTKHFPKDCLEKYGVLCQTADDFLIHQYHLCPQLVLDKLDDQGAGISQDRAFIVASLKNSAPKFCEFVGEHAM
ncbi:MAG TPA: PIN domain-containing protein [Terriglobales bacterium]|jgi:predicted nucleic acid-binding protein|nr:PIN domain-containing protein [Terriglobales bacterium]